MLFVEREGMSTAVSAKLIMHFFRVAKREKSKQKPNITNHILFYFSARFYVPLPEIVNERLGRSTAAPCGLINKSV